MQIHVEILEHRSPDADISFDQPKQKMFGADGSMVEPLGPWLANARTSPRSIGEAFEQTSAPLLTDRQHTCRKHP